MSSVLRLYGDIGEVRKDDQNELTRYWVISNSTPDMHRTVIPVDSWDLDFFNRAGAFYYQHITDGNSYFEPNPNLALGPARARVEGTDLIGQGTFEPEDKNELAGTIMFKVDYGTMRMTSVGFRPIKQGHWGKESNDEDPELYYFEGQRLLEFSCVHIASNLSAEKKSIDSMNEYLMNEIENHPSKAYQKDFKRHISWMNNRTFIIPKKKEVAKVDSMAGRVMEHRLFINKNKLQNV